jgi:hypothetical protein
LRLVCFFRGNRLAAGVHLGKIILEPVDDFLPPLIRGGRGLERADTDGFLLKYLAAEKVR